MSKDELLKLIEDSIIIEERAIPIYQEHIDSALFWSGFSAEQQETIKSTLEEITKDSEKHIAILNALKKKVEARNV